MLILLEALLYIDQCLNYAVKKKYINLKKREHHWALIATQLFNLVKDNQYFWYMHIQGWGHHPRREVEITRTTKMLSHVADSQNIFIVPLRPQQNCWFIAVCLILCEISSNIHLFQYVHYKRLDTQPFSQQGVCLLNGFTFTQP